MKSCNKLRKTLLIPLALSLSGCMTTGAATDISCMLFQPILVSRQDNLTHETAYQILLHNETGALSCGWRSR